MTHKNFEVLTEGIISKIRNISETKGKEYCNSESDRLANFKEIGEAIGITPFQCLLTYSMKHSRAIENYCKVGSSHSNENITSRILDRIVYDILLWGLIEDKLEAEGKLIRGDSDVSFKHYSTSIEELKREIFPALTEHAFRKDCYCDDCESQKETLTVRDSPSHKFAELKFTDPKFTELERELPTSDVKCFCAYCEASRAKERSDAGRDIS